MKNLARLEWAAWLAAIGFAWLWTWRHLAVEWRLNEQYQYGWGVPALFALAAWRRWPGPMASHPRTWPVWLLLLAGGANWTLGELLRWHDPIWRATGGLLVLGATCVTAAAFWSVGGWPLLRRQLFPLCIAWLGLAWPVGIELLVTQHSLAVLTSITTVVMNHLGIAALQRGNVIEFSGGMIGIEDACSGIQSFQASLLASVFLGEYLRLTAVRRALLVVAGWGIALGANLGRVLVLSWITGKLGTDSFERWHDLVGTAATVLTFGGILFLASRMEHLPASLNAGREDASDRLGSFHNSDRKPSIPASLMACVLIAAAPVFAAVRFAEPASPQTAHAQWRLDARELDPNWRAEPWESSSREHTMLRFSEREGWRLRLPDGAGAHIVHFYWAPGANMPGAAFYHTPAMCLPWSGWKIRSAPETLAISFGGREWPFVLYRFEQDNARLIALQTLSNGGEPEPFLVDPARIPNRLARLLTLWHAPRRQVNEELLLYLSSPGSELEMVRTAKAVLDAMVKPSAQSTAGVP